MSSRKLADALGRVIALRAELETDAQHKKRWLAVKQWQIERMRATYADLLATDRYHEAAKFFFEELYGATDVDQRDAEAQKVAPKLAAMLPARAVDALLLAVQLEEMAEQFDIEMARKIELPITAKNYAEAYRATGTKAERVRQIELADRIGKALEKLAKVPMLSTMLHMMKAPAAMWGLSHCTASCSAGSMHLSACVAHASSCKRQTVGNWRLTNGCSRAILTHFAHRVIPCYALGASQPWRGHEQEILHRMARALHRMDGR